MKGKADGTKKFTYITFEITNNCNKDCKYCIKMPKKEDKIEYMKIEDYKYVVSCITKKDKEKFRKILVTGGEALLHPKCIELITLMRKDFPKAEISLLSNGLLLKKLPQKILRILPNIKNLLIIVSDYKGWNDDIKERYDGNYKLPKIWYGLINKLTVTNRFIKYINLYYRFPFVAEKVRRFLLDPLKRSNVYFSVYTGFWNVYDDPNISEKLAKEIRVNCYYNIVVMSKRRLYNCCMSEGHERYYNTESISVEFDENWKKNFFKLPTWKACVHCKMGVYNYKLANIVSKIGNKKYIELNTREKLSKTKSHK